MRSIVAAGTLTRIVTTYNDEPDTCKLSITPAHGAVEAYPRPEPMGITLGDLRAIHGYVQRLEQQVDPDSLGPMLRRAADEGIRVGEAGTAGDMTGQGIALSILHGLPLVGEITQGDLVSSTEGSG